MDFDELVKVIDDDIMVDISDAMGRPIYYGRLRNIKKRIGKVLKVIPQKSSREVYLEIIVY